MKRANGTRAMGGHFNAVVAVEILKRGNLGRSVSRICMPGTSEVAAIYEVRVVASISVDSGQKGALSRQRTPPFINKNSGGLDNGFLPLKVN